MPSERMQRQIDRLLDEAELGETNWSLVRDRAQNVLALDPDNSDARSYLAAADVHSGPKRLCPSMRDGPTKTPANGSTATISFANGCYQATPLLGECAKKRVRLAHGTRLGRGVSICPNQDRGSGR